MPSIHDKLEKTRKPRIHIKYEVETEAGTVQKELPFVVGVMGDFSGDNPGKTVQPLKDRKFITINQDNFDDVLQKINPSIQMRVENTLTNDDSEISINLKFESLQDFEPAQLVNQIAPLRQLKETRDKLRDLLSKTDRSDDLEKILENILQNENALHQLATELNIKE